MKKVLGIFGKLNAVSFYRLENPFEHIQNETKIIHTITKDGGTVQEIANALKEQGDIWVVKYLPDNKLIPVLLAARDLVGAKLVVDIDDNMWNIPYGNPAIYAWSAKNLAMMSQLITRADAVIASTEPLAQFMRSWSNKVTVLPNAIDETMWGNAKRRKNRKVRIGYVYSPTHRPDLHALDKSLPLIAEKYKGKVDFYFLGGEKYMLPMDYKIVKGVPFRGYPTRLESMNLDISIAPLVDNLFNQCKSNIKWLESTMAGVPFVGSNVYPYEMSIVHGKTGMLCGSTNQWVNALSKLIESEELRKELVANAREEVLKNYDIKKIAKQYEEFFESL